MDNKSGKKRLVLLNILLALLAFSVIAVFYLNDLRSSKEGSNENEDNKVVDIEENTESPTETTKVSVEGNLYDLDKIPAIQKGTKFRFFSSLTGVTKVELVLSPSTITYSTPGDTTGKWEIEIDTTKLEVGNYSTEIKFFRQGEKNSSSKENTTFSVQDGNKAESFDFVSSLKPYWIYGTVSLVIIVVMNIAINLTLFRKKKGLAIEAKVYGKDEEIKLEPEKELDLSEEVLTQDNSTNSEKNK